MRNGWMLEGPLSKLLCNLQVERRREKHETFLDGSAVDQFGQEIGNSSLNQPIITALDYYSYANEILHYRPIVELITIRGNN